MHKGKAQLHLYAALEYLKKFPNKIVTITGRNYMYAIRQDKRNGFYAVWDASEHDWKQMEPISEYFLTQDEALDCAKKINTQQENN